MGRTKRNGFLRPRLLLLGLGVPVLLVWLLPVLVAKTSLRQKILPTVLPKYEGRFDVGSASLGWFSTIELKDVRVLDKNDHLLMSIDRVASSNTLLELIKDRSDVGTFDLTGIAANVELTQRGSNIEDALAPLSDSEGSSAQVAITWSKSTIEVHDQATDRKWTIRDFAGSLEKPRQATTPLTANITGTIVEAERTGDIEADVSWHAADGAQKGNLGVAEIKLAARNAPSVWMSPVLRRFAPTMDFSGQLNGDAVIRWDDSQPEWMFSVDSDVVSTGFAMTAPDWFGQESVATDRLHANGAVTWQAGRLAFDTLTVESSLANVAADGAVPLGDLSGRPFSTWLLEALRNEQYRVAAEVDLAELARTLPTRMNLRDGLTLESGELRIAVANQFVDGRQQWSAGITTSQVVATRDGRRLTWDQPISLTIRARESSDGPVVDQVDCQSDFLTLTGGGTMREASLTATADLDRLAAQLGQFVDFGDTQFAGALRANLGLRRSEENLVALGANAEVTNLAWQLGDRKPLREPKLKVGAAATVRLLDSQPNRLETATLQVTAGEDFCEAALQQPVSLRFADKPIADRVDELTSTEPKTGWPLSITMKGDAGSWLSRLDPFLPKIQHAIGGKVDAVANATLSPERVSVSSLRIDVTDLFAIGPGLQVTEPVAQFRGQGVINLAEQRLNVQSITFACTSVSCLSEDAVIQFVDNGPPVIVGTAEYRADLKRLSRWWQVPGQQRKYRVSGTVNGVVEASHADAVTHVTWNSDLKDGMVEVPGEAAAGTANQQPPWKVFFKEPLVTFTGAAAYHHVDGQLSLADSQLGTEAAKVAIRGTVNNLLNQPTVNLAGQVDYDAAAVSQWLRSYVGDGVKLAGRQSRQFAIRGPLPLASSDAEQADVSVSPVSASANARSKPRTALRLPNDLAADASFGWEKAALYGLPVGKVDIDARLQQQMVRFNPLSVTVGEGRLHLSPRIDFKSDPAVVVLEKGRVVERMRITEGMCDSWLKYVAPIVAATTRAEGRFSVDLSSATIPVFSPKDAQAAGVLVIEGARLSPGPLGQQLLLVPQAVATLLKHQIPTLRPATNAIMVMDPHDVEFQMVGRVVYFRGLKIRSGEVTVHTSGAVGVDQSVDLIAEVSILDEWVAGDRLLAPLRGQVIRVPIRGSLDKPKLDSRVLTDLATNLFGNATRNLIEGEALRGLDRLLNPRD
jgi:translocation and assembly module TamB